MIWFDIKSLEVNLTKNEISERTGYHYLLAFLIIIALALNGKEQSDFTNDIIRFFDVIIGLTITIWGTGKVFKINNEASDRDFLKRYFSLCFVHTLRISVVVFLITLVYNLMIEFIFTKYSESLGNIINNDYAKFAFSLLFQIVFYFLLIRSFKKINHFSENTEAVSS